jgi:TonB family protein
MRPFQQSDLLSQCMSNRPIPKPDPSRFPLEETTETDVVELAALFAARSGAGVSTKLSADLALEIVLNEIVERACIATGATGAAVILEREGEMVCRATSGPNAPDLGSRPDSESGLTAECIRTGQVQLCNDASSDPRADAEASRNLGVRSVIVLPLVQDGAVIGALEAFSSLPTAFGERDQATLQALCERILRNLRRANEPSALQVMQSTPDSLRTQTGLPNIGLNSGASSKDVAEGPVPPLSGEHLSASPSELKPGVDILTIVLAAACVVCLILIVTLVTLRATSRKTMDGRRPPAAAQAIEHQSADTAQNQVETVQNQAGSTSTQSPENGNHDASKPVPVGGLVVYDGAKEVFRLPPSSSAVETSEQSASALPRQQETIQLTPDAAASSVVYRKEPEYPEEARSKGIQGPVVLDVHIGRDGSVQDATLVNGPPLLADAAIAAVKQWRFKPHYLHGRPAEMQTRVQLNFRLPQ